MGVEVVSEAGSSPSGKVSDVKGWLESMGILFPPGSEALYFFDRSQLIVRNTKENLELIKSLNSCNNRMGYPIHKSEITLVAFNPSAERLGNPTASFDQLKKNAGDSWKEIATLQFVSKSGVTVHSQAIFGQKSVSVSALKSDTTGPASIKAPDLPPSAEGNTCALQIVVGPDRRTIDANLSFRLRSVLPGSKEPLTIQFDGSTTVQDGYPQVLQIVEPTENGPAYALVLRITGVLAETTPPLNEAKNIDSSP